MRNLLSTLLMLQVLAMHSSIAAMEIFSWSVFAVTLGWMLARKERFHFPLAPVFFSLSAVVGLSLWWNPPLKPFLLQFGFMRFFILFWAYSWAFLLVWDDVFENRLIKVWSAALLLAAAYGVFEFLTGLEFFHRGQVVFPQGDGLYKATGFFSFSLTYAYVIGASFLSLTLPLAARLRRWQFALFLLLGVAGVVASMSKGAWIGLVLAFSVYVACTRPRLLPVFAAGVAISAAALAAVWLPFRAKILTLVTLQPDHSAGMRMDLWRAYGSMVQDHPWLGVGLFQGDKLLPEYYQRLGLQQDFISHAHNVLLAWAAGAGLFSLLLYLVISAWFLKLAWDLRQRTPWGWSILLAQIYLHAGGLTETNFFDGEVNHLILFLWAILVHQNSATAPAQPNGDLQKV